MNAHVLLSGLASAALLASSSPSAAQTSRERPSVTAVRTTDPIRIDGVLDEAAWSTARLVDTFIQQEPNEGQPATDRTEVRVLYDKGHL